MTDDLAAKAVDTDWGILRLGNEVFPMAGATFVRNETTPDVWDSNHVSEITARTLQEIEALFATAEREYAFANHRRFEVDHRTPPEFVARLQMEEGFTTDGAIILLLEGELKGTAKERDIRPVNSDADWEAFWDLHLLNWNAHNDAAARGGDAVARQMWQSKRIKSLPAQWWLAYESEKPVAYFNHWAGIGSVGQVEDLFTHQDFRNRGIATSLIHHCVAQARAAGAGPIVIAADPHDTPKHIYHRMGFRPVATITHYTKRLNT